LESFNVFSHPREKPGKSPPVLLGWGTQNRTLDVKWAGIIADWLAPERLYLVENAGHMTNYEKPEEVNERLASFLEMSGE
jgi:pimeloyl-ACP methyl ester carboxylesterase